MVKLKNKITVEPICFSCIHFNNDGSYSCTAFPKDIPMPVLTGETDHDKPLPGQENAIVYTPIDGQ